MDCNITDHLTSRLTRAGFVVVLCVLSSARGAAAGPKEKDLNPYDRQVAEQVAKLKADSPAVRSAAAEALGYLRAFSAASALARASGDESAVVRREAVMSLGWCGGRKHLNTLLDRLGDTDWTVRQAAWVALTNITGMELKFDALAKTDARSGQIKAWRAWWADFQAGKTARPPDKTARPPKASRKSSRRAAGDDLRMLALERKARSLGALGGLGDVAEVVRIVKPYLTAKSCNPSENSMVQVCLRSLGRLGGDEARKTLIAFLSHPRWARYAADALGDIGGNDAQSALIRSYPRFARSLKLDKPRMLPRDDYPGLDPRDRMYQTPYAIILALSRMNITDPKNLKALGAIAPLLLANMPSDYDGALLYEPEAYQLITAYLIRKTGLQRAVCKAAFAQFGQGDSSPGALANLAKKYAGDVPYAAIWLPTFCEKQDVPKLIALLDHKNGWVRINAAKAIMFLDDKRGVAPIAKLLKASKPEATFGYYGEYFNNKTQGHAEYNDPAPRWREAFVRALGRLQAAEHIGMLSKIMRDDQNTLGIQHAAAIALDELGTDKAMEALKQTEENHPFYSIRIAAREALWKRGMLKPRDLTPPMTLTKTPTKTPVSKTYRIVFIKGTNKMPNCFQIDPWRQTYSTTDSGPTYRLGDNLYILNPNGKVSQLTHFKDGYVADCEVSWDGKRIIFAKRGGKVNPWWHVWEIGADGKGLRQITKGPYHDVQPAYLSDGRIIFSSSRIGLRDEYHGYPATGLTVMNADGSDMHVIALNLGRDNEPSMLPDGRIVFSRLELFYSRLKTELTVHAINPDGTRDVTLYGPERRKFWRNVTRASKERWWGEAPPRHRVLRMTQPQSFDDGRIICATTAGLTIIGPGRYRETLRLGHSQHAVSRGCE
jgi:HEAT repeat protein